MRSRAGKPGNQLSFPAGPSPWETGMEVGRGKLNPCKDPGTHQSNFTISRLCGNSEPEKEEEQKSGGRGPQLWMSQQFVAKKKKNFLGVCKQRQIAWVWRGVWASLTSPSVSSDHPAHHQQQVAQGPFMVPAKGDSQCSGFKQKR